MIYIGFSKRSHKLYARILCKKFRHCAPVDIHGNKCLLYQFVHKNKIVIIPITKRDLSILSKYGWKFIKYNYSIAPKDIKTDKSWTCVQFTKRVCKIKNKRVQTPYDLFKYLTHK